MFVEWIHYCDNIWLITELKGILSIKDLEEHN